jgi:hypothetical protein
MTVLLISCILCSVAFIVVLSRWWERASARDGGDTEQGILNWFELTVALVLARGAEFVFAWFPLPRSNCFFGFETPSKDVTDDEQIKILGSRSCSLFLTQSEKGESG